MPDRRKSNGRPVRKIEAGRTCPSSHSLSVADDRLLRQVFGSFTTGVTVVTYCGPQGEPLGATVSSFTSVSLDPPLVLVCLKRNGRSAAAIADEGSFAINVLQSRQRDAASAFAGTIERFQSPKWSWTDSGLPVLSHSLATIECAVHDVVEAGDHDIIVGCVMDLSSDQRGLEPLVYYRGQFRRLSAIHPNH